MTTFENSFKTALREGRRQVGLWLTTGSASVTEIAAGAGFDWLLIDMEHAPNDLTQVVEHLRAAVGGTAEPVVRVPWNEPVQVKRLLDQGARSLMFPFVQDAEEARRAVAATRYPPAGIRGLAGTSRATAYGRRAGYANRAAEEICVVVQLESENAIAQAERIAAVDGVDGVFIGPNDLAAAMGYLGKVDAPPVKAAIDRALVDIRSQNKAAGILDFRESSAHERFDTGFGFVAVSGDGYLIARETQRLVDVYRRDP